MLVAWALSSCGGQSVAVALLLVYTWTQLPGLSSLPPYVSGMQFENGTKLRRYIFMQQLLIGIVQGLLTMALLPMHSSLSKWISGFTATLNFISSITLVGLFGVDKYPTGVSDKQTKAICLIGSSFAGNFIALCALLVDSQERNLTSILTFKSGYTPLNAFALFFYLTVYITLLLSIGFATYCLIDVSDPLPQPDKEGDDDPEQRAREEDGVPGIFVPSQFRRKSILKDQCQISMQNVRAAQSHQKPEPTKHQRRASQNSVASLGFQTRRFNATHQIPSDHGDEYGFCEQAGRRRSSAIRGRPMHTTILPSRPPTPPPPPPPAMWAKPIQEQAKTYRNLNHDIAKASRDRKERTDAV